MDNTFRDSFKDAFAAWDRATTRAFERALKNPLVLEPLGAVVTLVSSALAVRERMITRAWGLVGLATRRDQERLLHAINQLQSRLLDLEERLPERGR